MNAQINLNNQLRTQYSNLLKVNLFKFLRIRFDFIKIKFLNQVNNILEKSNDEMREKLNDLLIQKDLLENDLLKLKILIETEKSNNHNIVNRINELEANNQLCIFENNKLKDKEHYFLNEILKHQTMMNQLEREKMSLENQIKSLEQNINQNEAFLNHQTNDISNNFLNEATNRKHTLINLKNINNFNNIRDFF